MHIVNFTPVSAVVGGAIIGVSAAMLLVLLGRIAGVSSVLGGLLASQGGDRLWRVLFLAGLVFGTLVYITFGGSIGQRNTNPYALDEVSHWVVLMVAGVLVGVGTRVGSGCTSGHGVCGIGRLSARSIVATLIFMVSAMITVFVVRWMMVA